VSGVTASKIYDDRVVVCFTGRKEGEVGSFEFSRNFTDLPSSESRELDAVLVESPGRVKKTWLHNNDTGFGCSLNVGQDNDFEIVSDENLPGITQFKSIFDHEIYSVYRDKNTIFYDAEHRYITPKSFSIYFGETMSPTAKSYYPFHLWGEGKVEINVSTKHYVLALLYDYVSTPRYAYNIMTTLLGRS